MPKAESQHLDEWNWIGCNIDEDQAIATVDAKLKRIALGGYYKLDSKTAKAGGGGNVASGCLFT